MPLQQKAPCCLEHEESWFALRVKTRCEKLVADSLSRRGYQEFLPLFRARRKWSDRYQEVDLPLFPGYVFCHFPIHRRLPILTVPGVLHVVGIGKTPLPVDEHEIAALRSAVDSGLLMQPWPFLKVGQVVRLEEGPLRNVEGILTEIKGSHQLVVSITLLQRSVAVSVERHWVRPYSN